MCIRQYATASSGVSQICIASGTGHSLSAVTLNSFGLKSVMSNLAFRQAFADNEVRRFLRLGGRIHDERPV